MSIESAIENAQQKVANAYTAVENKGGTLPATQNLSNLPTAINTISTAGTVETLNVTPTTSAQQFVPTGGVDGYNPVNVSAVTSDIDADIIASNIKQGVNILGVTGSVVELKGETKTVTPTTSQQTITPSSGKNGITEVTVNAVTSSIDNNITAGNIKKDVSILGVTGTYEGVTPTLTTKNITENGTYNASSDNADGYSSVTVNVPNPSTGTLSITQNGTYDVTDYASADVNVSGGGGYPTGNYYVMNDGSIQPLYFYNALLLDSQNNQVTKNNVCFSPDFTTMNELTETGKAYTHPSYAPENLTAYSIKMGNFGNLPNNPSFPILLGGVKHVNLSGVNGKIWFQGSSVFPAALFTSLESIDMSNATNVYLRQVFSENIVKTVDLSSVIEISEQYAMQRAFTNSQLETIDLSSLTTVSGSQAFNLAFTNSQLETIDLSSLTTVSGSQAFLYAFQACKRLISVNFSSLATVGNKAFANAFSNSSLTSLSFPALTSTSFGNYTNQFDSMLRQVTGCTVHFPSNLQSVIGSWTSVTSGFGGTNTTVLFDLPATT